MKLNKIYITLEFMKTLRHICLVIMLACAGVSLSSCDLTQFLEEVMPGVNDGNKDEKPEEEDKEEDKVEDEKPGPQNTEFVMLFTNDFHSQIEPTADDQGGVLRLEALIDSVRTAEPVVLLADAGDLVQGSDYFSLLNGVVEMQMLDVLGYDIRTIGNHEFDKKMTGLGEMFALSKVPVVASNYDFSNTDVASYVVPSKILDAGALKIGFIGLSSEPCGPKGMRRSHMAGCRQCS